MNRAFQTDPALIVSMANDSNELSFQPMTGYHEPLDREHQSVENGDLGI
jgi:hypothetical protein